PGDQPPLSEFWRPPLRARLLAEPRDAGVLRSVAATGGVALAAQQGEGGHPPQTPACGRQAPVEAACDASRRAVVHDPVPTARGLRHPRRRAAPAAAAASVSVRRVRRLHLRDLETESTQARGSP